MPPIVCKMYCVTLPPPQNAKGKTALDYAVLYSCDDCAALRAAGATGSKKTVAAKATKDKTGKKGKTDKMAATSTKKDKESE